MNKLRSYISYHNIEHIPWIKESTDIYNLEDEINDYIYYVTPNYEENNIIKELFFRIMTIISTLYPSAKCEIFGSYYSNSNTHLSDLDINVYGIDFSVEIAYNIIDTLKEYMKTDSCTFVSKSHVPLIKLTDTLTNIEVDISFNNIDGVKSSQLMKDLFTEYTYSRELFIIIKMFINNSNLNNGGITSYIIQLMVISFFQNHKPNNYELMNIVDLLMAFLSYYGMIFDYSKKVIDVRNKCLYMKSDNKYFIYNDKWSLSIEDPLNKYIDIGRRLDNILKYRDFFKETYYRIIRENETENNSILYNVLGFNIKVEYRKILHRNILIMLREAHQFDYLEYQSKSNNNIFEMGEIEFELGYLDIEKYEKLIEKVKDIQHKRVIKIYYYSILVLILEKNYHKYIKNIYLKWLRFIIYIVDNHCEIEEALNINVNDLYANIIPDIELFATIVGIIDYEKLLKNMKSCEDYNDNIVKLLLYDSIYNIHRKSLEKYISKLNK